jgi:hypothetical protein
VPEGLGAPDIADAGDHPLVEERLSDRDLGRPSQVGDDPVERERARKHVRPEPPKRPVGQLEHWAVPEDSLALGTTQHEPRAPAQRRAPVEELPPTAHAQVAAKHDAAFEAEHEVLSDRLDAV